MFVANMVLVSKGSVIDGPYFSSFVVFPMTECLRSATLKISGLLAALPEQMATKEE